MLRYWTLWVYVQVQNKPEKDLGAMDEEVQIGEGNFCNLNVTGWGRKKRITLPHTAYDRYKGWIATKPQGNPELPLQAAVCVSGYQQLKVPLPKVSHRRVKIKSLPDTRAQMTVVGMKFMHALGIKRSELNPLSRGVNAANNSKLGLLGGALVEFSGKNCDGEVRASKQRLSAKVSLCGSGLPHHYWGFYESWKSSPDV